MRYTILSHTSKGRCACLTSQYRENPSRWVSAAVTYFGSCDVEQISETDEPPELREALNAKTEAAILEDCD